MKYKLQNLACVVCFVLHIQYLPVHIVYHTKFWCDILYVETMLVIIPKKHAIYSVIWLWTAKIYLGICKTHTVFHKLHIYSIIYLVRQVLSTNGSG